MNVGMSGSVTASIRESIRNLAIGKTRTHDKADRATVELVKPGCFFWLAEIFLLICCVFCNGIVVLISYIGCKGCCSF